MGFLERKKQIAVGRSKVQRIEGEQNVSFECKIMFVSEN